MEKRFFTDNLIQFSPYNPGDVIILIANAFIALIVILSVYLLLMGIIMYLTGESESEERIEGKLKLIRGSAGLFLAILATLLVRFFLLNVLSNYLINPYI